jgi:hypothetical protein
MATSGIIVCEDCFLVVADIDSVINALWGGTGGKDVGLECGRSIWGITSWAVPGIDHPVLNTKSYSLACCSLPNHLGELQGGLLSSVRVRFASGEVVVLLALVPFLSGLVGSEYLVGAGTFEPALSTASVLGWSI